MEPLRATKNKNSDWCQRVKVLANQMSQRLQRTRNSSASLCA